MIVEIPQFLAEGFRTSQLVGRISFHLQQVLFFVWWDLSMKTLRASSQAKRTFGSWKEKHMGDAHVD